MKTIFSGAAAALCIVGGAASAASVTFDLTGSRGLTSGSYVWTDAATGLSLTATAFKEADNSGALGSQVWLGQYGNGLGVTSSGTDQHFLDSNDDDELIRLTFSAPVRMTSATFSYWDSFDDFSFGTYSELSVPLSYDIAVTATCDVGSCTGTGGSVATNSVLALYGTHSIFAIGASGTGDEFKLKGVTVNYNTTPPPPPPNPGIVPLPAAGWLMLGAIGGLGLTRRRSRG